MSTVSVLDEALGLASRTQEQDSQRHRGASRRSMSLAEVQIEEGSSCRSTVVDCLLKVPYGRTGCRSSSPMKQESGCHSTVTDFRRIVVPHFKG